MTVAGAFAFSDDPRYDTAIIIVGVSTAMSNFGWAGIGLYTEGKLDTGGYISLGLGATSAIATLIYVLRNDSGDDSSALSILPVDNGGMTVGLSGGF